MKVSVKKSPDTNRRAPWMVRYYQNRKPVRKFFETKEEAETHATDLRSALRSGVSAEEMQTANRLIAGTGHSLTALVRAALDNMRENNSAEACPTMTLADAAQRLLERTKARRVKTYDGYVAAFRRISLEFGTRIGSTITCTEARAYLDRLPNRKGHVGCASPFSKATVLRYLKMLIRACGVPNPLPGLDLPAARHTEIAFFSVDEARLILAKARPSEKGQVALALFAAIRPETVERLSERHVNTDEKSIRIPAELAKDNMAHFLETVPLGTAREVRPGPPEVLWEWLRRYPFKPHPWVPIRTRLKSALGGKWIQDGLRHTGATYYRAKYGDAATAELLTHASLRLVNKHYAGLTTRAEAEAFMALSPSAVPDSSRSQPINRLVVNWPTDDELAEMLQKAPASKIAAILGCSDSMVGKRCRRRGITKPGRGHWTKNSYGESDSGVES